MGKMVLFIFFLMRALQNRVGGVLITCLIPRQEVWHLSF